MPHYSSSAFFSTSWIRSRNGTTALRHRTATASEILADPSLAARVAKALAAAAAEPTFAREADLLLRTTLEEIQILALAHHGGLRTPEAAWKTSARVLESILAMETLACQGRTAVPPWAADLSSADLGVFLALIVAMEPPIPLSRPQVERFLRAKCWDPAATEWLEHASRPHSLDSMGHNWWSVIVGGAGAVAALMGWKKEARRAASALTEWFGYPGNRSLRKFPNFGPEGDFLEGFAYCDYALIHPFLLAALLGGKTLTEWLEISRWRGLAEWYRHAFVPTRDGHWPKRFGDIALPYRPKPAVWHPLAALTGDRKLLGLAQSVVPRPTTALDFLLWRSSVPAAAGRPEPRRIYPTSGCAFLENGGLSVSVRAGEFWNHNHLDAGTFILAQTGTVWIDDAGTCRYHLPEYINHYAAPSSHNVTWAPSLIPPLSPSKELGLDLKGEFILAGRTRDMEFLHLDTRLLSGGSLHRSRRSFFTLGEEAVIIWDDVEARAPERFETLLHTSQPVAAEGSHGARLTDDAGNSFTALCYSDAAIRRSIRPVKMGEVRRKDAAPLTLGGSEIRWQSARADCRRKVLLVLGVGVGPGKWKESAAGWECRFKTRDARWTVWFNGLADGRIAHQNTIGVWKGLETDAYALLRREAPNSVVLHACNASFVRQGGRLLHGSFMRTPLARMEVAL